MLPAVTGIRAVISRASVDFPHPDSPTRPRVSPRLISRSTPSTARTASPPNPPIGKCLYAPLMWTSTGSVAATLAGARSAACIAPHLGRRRLQLLRGFLGARALLRLLDVFLFDVPHQHPAPRDLTKRNLVERRLWVDLAAVHHERAARVELAPRGRMCQVRWQALDRDEPVLSRLVNARHRAQQRPRVGMLRALEDLINRALFDDPARVHDHDTLAKARHQRHLVGDQHHGRAALAIELLHELDDLRLDGDVERGSRLV